MIQKWRVGRKVGRTIYVQLGEEPSDRDPLIGMMDTPEIAALAVRGVNALLREASVVDLNNSGD